jgi:hypothetical protein
MGFRWDLSLSSVIVIVVALVLRFILPPAKRISRVLAAQYVGLAALIAMGMLATSYFWMLTWAIVTASFSIVVLAEIIFAHQTRR